MKRYRWLGFMRIRFASASTFDCSLTALREKEEFVVDDVLGDGGACFQPDGCVVTRKGLWTCKVVRGKRRRLMR